MGFHLSCEPAGGLWNVEPFPHGFPPGKEFSALIIVSASEAKVGTTDFADATDFHGRSASIRRIRVNPQFLLAAETMIKAEVSNALDVSMIDGLESSPGAIRCKPGSA